MLARLKTMIGSGTVTADLDDPEGILEEIDELCAENRESKKHRREARILKLRQLAGIALMRRETERHELVEPDYEGLPAADLPEVTRDELTPELIRGAILSRGAILVRGLIDTADAAMLADGIDQAFADRKAQHDNGASATPYYHEFAPEPYQGPINERDYIELGGGVLAGDSPRLAFDMTEAFDRADLRDLIAGYLQERPAFSAHKTTLRKAEPDVPGAWHQDGKFLGDVNSLNLWLALSHCGDTAPGMDLVPRRLDYIVDAGVGDVGFTKIVVTQEQAEELAGESGIMRPIFEPGDAMFFDHLFLHQTASDPSMPNPRFAIESWFFGPSAFPDGYVPLAY